MTKTEEFVKGNTDIQLTDGSTITVRAIRLADLQKTAQALMGLFQADDMLKQFDLSLQSAMGLLPHLLKLPEFMGTLCGKDEKWFANLPLEDEMRVFEAVVEVSNLESILPRFFKLVGRLKAAMPTQPQPKISSVKP